MAEKIRRQVRSATVVVAGACLLAAALTACSDSQTKRCVDRGSYDQSRGYKVLSDDECSGGSTDASGTSYYGGTVDHSWVSGGSFTKKSTSGGSGGGSHHSRHRSRKH